MAHEHLMELAAKIYRATISGNAEWEDDPLYPGFALNLPSGKCRVAQDDNGKNYFAIHNSADDILEQVSSTDIDDNFDFGSNELKDLYDRARRKALKTDELISQLIQEVDDIDFSF
jgi:hypothetical protein